MLDCLIIGDSIGVGISTFLNCHQYTKIGMNSSSLVKIDILQKEYTIISIGSNDSLTNLYLNNLIKFREKIKNKVIWILPINQLMRNEILLIASHWNDSIVDFQPTIDNVHPKSYKKLASDIRRKINGN